MLPGAGTLATRWRRGREAGSGRSDVVANATVAVGMALAGHPPHRSVREQLPHTALTSGVTINLQGFSYARQADVTLFAALCPQRVKLACRFPLVGPLPSTDSAADDPALFARFVGTMGPSDSLKTCMSGYGTCLPRPSPTDNRRGSLQGLPVLAHGVSTHAQGLRLRGVHKRLAINIAHDVAFPLSGQSRHAEGMISELNGWPARTPVNASPAVLPSPAHDSGPRWIATPFLCGSFIRYSMPVYPGAFPDPVILLVVQRAARNLPRPGHRWEARAGPRLRWCYAS